MNNGQWTKKIQDSALTHGAVPENFGVRPNMKTAPSQERVHVSGKRHGIDTNDKDSSASKLCGFKMVDPKMPQFAGHVREYDFTHAFDSRLCKRYAISLLLTSLQGKPLESITGIGTAYNTAAISTVSMETRDL